MNIYSKSNGIEPINLTELSKTLNKDKANICRKAKQLGYITNLNRKKNPDTLLQLNEKFKEYLLKNGHPKGMLGKKQSNEFKIKVSQRTKEQWNNPLSVFNSEEFRNKSSDRMKIRYQTDSRLRHGYSRGRGGKRKDLKNRYFRSSWEANYARYLNYLIQCKKIYKWNYEEDIFNFDDIKRGIRSYTPDFKIWDTRKSIPYYHEVKGWMDKKSKIKLKRMKKYYPNINVEVIDSVKYNNLKKEMSKIIDNWEF